MEYTDYNIETLKILLVNMQDATCRAFMETIPTDAYTDLTIINWYDKSDYDKVQWYLHDCHFPSPSKFPSMLYGLPRSKTFGDKDQVALISGMTSYEQAENEAMSEVVLRIVENICMSESYKLSFIRKQILIDETISLAFKTAMLTCKTVEELEILYALFVKENVLVRSTSLEQAVFQETEVDLGFTLRIPQYQLVKG